MFKGSCLWWQRGGYKSQKVSVIPPAVSWQVCPPQLNSQLKSWSTHQACPQYEARYPLGVGWPLGWLSGTTATPPLTMPRVPSCSWVAVSSCRHRWRAVACCFSSLASRSCAMLPQPLLPAVIPYLLGFPLQCTCLHLSQLHYTYRTQLSHSATVRRGNSSQSKHLAHSTTFPCVVRK